MLLLLLLLLLLLDVQRGDVQKRREERRRDSSGYITSQRMRKSLCWTRNSLQWPRVTAVESRGESSSTDSPNAVPRIRWHKVLLSCWVPAVR